MAKPGRDAEIAKQLNNLRSANLHSTRDEDAFKSVISDYFLNFDDNIDSPEEESDSDESIECDVSPAKPSTSAHSDVVDDNQPSTSSGNDRILSESIIFSPSSLLTYVSPSSLHTHISPFPFSRMSPPPPLDRKSVV